MSDRHANLSPGLEVQSPPISTPLFPCRREVPLGTGPNSRFPHTCVHTRESPKDDGPQAGFRACSPREQWTGCPLLHWPFLEAHRLVSGQTPAGAGGNGNFSISSSFSVFSVSPTFTSPLILTHYTPTPFILKSYLCLYELLSLTSLLYVVSSVQQLLQVSAKTRWRI